MPLYCVVLCCAVLQDQKVPYARTSSLLAPTMLLTGHGGPVMCARFNPAGSYVASGSQDKSVLLWKTYGECTNFAQLNGHKNTVLALCWSRDGDQLYTASADNTGAVWDVEEGVRVRRFREHVSPVNSITASRKGDPLVVTCSDDCKAIAYDIRVKRSIQTIETEYQVSRQSSVSWCVCLSVRTVCCVILFSSAAVPVAVCVGAHQSARSCSVVCCCIALLFAVAVCTVGGCVGWTVHRL